MYSRVAFSHFARAFALVLIASLAAVAPVRAQAPSQPATAEQHQHPAATPAEEQEGHDMPMGMQLGREGSGTAWLPDSTPMYAIHWQRGPWQLMAHENAFVQFLHESGDRGDNQFGSINWMMGMAQRNAGSGRVTFRGMFSLEPWTIRGCGYPDLLASGEQCKGEKIHDRQHPHDLMMEFSAEYDAPLRGADRWQVYGGPVGEPALGPVAYPHRISALPNSLAPISHHWLDSTHITFGVATAGQQIRIATAADGPWLQAEHPSERDAAASRVPLRHTHHPIDAAELVVAAIAGLVKKLDERVLVHHQLPRTTLPMNGVHRRGVRLPRGA
jgi:hypothetical protein